MSRAITRAAVNDRAHHAESSGRQNVLARAWSTHRRHSERCLALSTQDSIHANHCGYVCGLCTANRIDQIRSQQSNPSSSGPLVYTILLVPRSTELCRKVLEDEGVAGDVHVSDVSGNHASFLRALQADWQVPVGTDTD